MLWVCPNTPTPIAWVPEYRLPNSVRDDLKPTVPELAMLLLMVLSCWDTALSPVRAILKLMNVDLVQID